VPCVQGEQPKRYKSPFAIDVKGGEKGSEEVKHEYRGVMMIGGA